jgi:hypothetical protein
MLPILYDAAVKKKTCLEFRKLYKQLDSTVNISIDDTSQISDNKNDLQQILTGSQDVSTVLSDTSQNKDNIAVVNNIT